MARNNTKPSQAETLYLRSPEWYEDSILLAALRCPDIWPLIHKTLCLGTDFKTEANDFSNPFRFHIYRAIKKYRALQSDAGTAVISTELSSSTIRTMLNLMSVENASTMRAEDIPETLEFYEKVIKDDQTEEELQTLVKCSYGRWILDRKIGAITEEAQYTDVRGKQYLDILHDSLDTLNARLGEKEEDTLKGIADVIDQDEVVTERLPFSSVLSPFNDALGGGLGKKEHIMIVGATGSGKTVFACQVAANMASQGFKVCYVTTEQPANELVPRIVSSMSMSSSAPIPFNLIKDGVERKKLSPEQLEMLDKIKDQLNPTLGIEEWLGSGLTASDLDNTVRKFKKRYGGLDVLVLDWIGGALDNLDPQLKRDYYLRAAQKMKELAYTHNIATVSMAQATADVTRVRYISDKHIAECKTIHREAVAGFGISSLADERENTEVTYSPYQYLYAFKSRKAPGRVMQLTRQFKYQSFTFGHISTVV